VTAGIERQWHCGQSMRGRTAMELMHSTSLPGLPICLSIERKYYHFIDCSLNKSIKFHKPIHFNINDDACK